jgi:hypothetical protein
MMWNTIFPFVEYGLDIDYMVMREQGIVMPEFTLDKLADYDPPKPLKEKVDEFLKTK